VWKKRKKSEREERERGERGARVRETSKQSLVAVWHEIREGGRYPPVSTGLLKRKKKRFKFKKSVSVFLFCLWNHFQNKNWQLFCNGYLWHYLRKNIFVVI
jgi:hypothetical protein